jgi:GNAT superfamily N-acetyltransferase
LSKLGDEAIRRYYEWQLVGPHDALNIGAIHKGALIGFCFSGVFRGAMGGFLQKNRLFLAIRVLTHPWLITNPLLRDKISSAVNILQLQRKIVAIPKDLVNNSPVTKTAFGILAIAVLPEYYGQGVSQQLMMYVEQKASEREFEELALTVHTTNSRAIRFYEKIGWERVYIDDNWTGRMKKKIDPIIKR